MDTLNILVCDDELGMRLGVERALRHFKIDVPEVDGEVHFTVDQAETGEEALDKIAKAPPHILLLDLKLPGISGLDVLEDISPRNLETLTVMITAYASIETAVRATKQGAYDFLAKPFTPAELRTTITKAARHLIVSRQARRLAQEKRQVRFQFISVLAHELKAPINAIEGYLNVLRDRSAGDDPATQDQILERCVTRIGGMRKMITDLLDLTRIESGQKRRELAEVDVRQVAEMAIETALPEARARLVAIEMHADGPVPMFADRGELEIILNNLVSNAVKYNRDGGRVDIHLEQEDGAVTVRVADTGIGMTKEECAKLFGDFVRIKNSKTKGIMGSGLGLSIVKKLALLYEGGAVVTSEPDVGTSITVTLKSAAPEEGAGSQADDAPTPGPAV